MIKKGRLIITQISTVENRVMLERRNASSRVRTGYGILEKLWNFEKEIPYMEKLWNFRFGGKKWVLSLKNGWGVGGNMSGLRNVVSMLLRLSLH